MLLDVSPIGIWGPIALLVLLGVGVVAALVAVIVALVRGRR